MRPGERVDGARERGAEVMKCEHPWRGVALLYKRLFVRSLPAFITDDSPAPSSPHPPSSYPTSQLHDGRPKHRANRKTGKMGREARRGRSFEIASSGKIAFSKSGELRASRQIRFCIKRHANVTPRDRGGGGGGGERRDAFVRYVLVVRK